MSKSVVCLCCLKEVPARWSVRVKPCKLFEMTLCWTCARTVHLEYARGLVNGGEPQVRARGARAGG